MACDGINETRRDEHPAFYCSALSELARKYELSKEDVVCTPEAMAKCKAARFAGYNAQASKDSLQSGKKARHGRGVTGVSGLDQVSSRSRSKKRKF